MVIDRLAELCALDPPYLIMIIAVVAVISIESYLTEKGEFIQGALRDRR